jgi:hypothetical protein
LLSTYETTLNLNETLEIAQHLYSPFKSLHKFLSGYQININNSYSSGKIITLSKGFGSWLIPGPAKVKKHCISSHSSLASSDEKIQNTMATKLKI